MISVTVTNRKAVAVPLTDVTVGAVGIPVSFHFTEDWDGLSKIAVFKAGDVTPVEVAILNNTANVPHEVLVDEYEVLWIGIYGSNAQGTTVIPTIWANAGAIQPGTELETVDPSEPTPSWVAQVQAAAEEALTIANEIKDDAESGAFDGEDGTDGVSPTVTVTDITGGHLVTITDANGSHSFSVMNGTDGQNGSDGQPGANGSDGRDGVDGQDGTDGISPTITIVNIDGGHRVTMTDVNGSHSFDVLNGQDGSTGPQGETGPAGATGAAGRGIRAFYPNGTSTVGDVTYDSYLMEFTDDTTFTLNVRRGAKGDVGPAGNDGITPTVEVTEIEGGHNVAFDYGPGDSRNTNFDVMDGADLSEDVDELKNAIELVENADWMPIPFTTGGTGNVNWSTGATSSSSTNSYTDYIDISKYPVIKYKREGFTGNAVVGGIAFYDENKTCIGGQRSLTGQANQGYISELQEITVPHGTKYVRCVAFTDTQTYGVFEIYGRTEIVNDVNIAQNAALGVAELKQSANLVNPYVIMDGLNINNSGTLTSASNRALVYWIPVKEGATYYFTFLTASGSFYGVPDKKAVATAFYSNMCVSNRVGTQGAYVGSFGPAPQGAKYMLMSFPNTYLTGSANDPIICVTENWYPANASEMPVYFTPYYSDKVSAQIEKNTDTITRTALHNDIVETVSHQGYKVNAPKSTKWAYIAAKQRGYKIVENDINFSSTTNRTLFMWHDETFGVCGDIVDADHGYLLFADGSTYYWYDSENDVVYDLDYESTAVSVSSLTRVNGSDLSCTSTPWKLIKEIDVGVRLGQKFKGTKVLTVEEWVLLCKQLGMDIYIDRKVNIESYVSYLVGIVKKHGMLDHASWVINASASIGTAIRAVDPNARLLLITRPSEEQLPAIATLAASGRGLAYDLSNDVMTSEVITEALTNGIQVEAYYVEYGSDTEETIFTEIRRLVDMGCTRLTLDKYMVQDAYNYLIDEYNQILH